MGRIWNNHSRMSWLRGKDLNLRPLGYEPNELPDCSTPQNHASAPETPGQPCAHPAHNSASPASYNEDVPRFLAPAVVALTVALSAQTAPTPTTFFPLKDVRAGMRG